MVLLRSTARIAVKGLTTFRAKQLPIYDCATAFDFTSRNLLRRAPLNSSRRASSRCLSARANMSASLLKRVCGCDATWSSNN